MLIECDKCKGKGYLIRKSKKLETERFEKICCNKCKGKGFINEGISRKKS